MISLILPYWDRQEAANKALELLGKHYANMALEVIVVDDGNRIPYKLPETDLNVKVVRLPLKDNPAPQSRAWNAGVKASTGNIIVLSCIEILHEKPVLLEMLARLKESYDYILAAAWSPDTNEWHCHPSIIYNGLPRGVGPSYLGMMYKSLFNLAGGFDEIYQDGAGYEDKDFMHRMLKVNARFKIQTDLVVTHPKIGAQIHWKQEGFVKNAAIYRSKWDRPINFVCLKAGTGYSAEYVNILKDMVLRNLPEGFRINFYCITDNKKGIDKDIEIIKLPSDLETWWGKLYMFKQGLFKDGDQMVFMDLDTVITGNLEKLLSYDGYFATLRDFAQPERLGPAIIFWKAGNFAGTIWKDWVNEGKPRNPMGDLWWLNKSDIKADILQDLYPDEFVSYKLHCANIPPLKAKVVCFHGLPRPDQADGWVKNFWKIGGYTSSDYEVICNTELGKVKENIEHSSRLGLPSLQLQAETSRKAIFCGGGPSLADSIDKLKAEYEDGSLIIAMNGSAKFLNKHGIKPHWMVMIDSRASNLEFIDDIEVDEYFIASQCCETVFNRLKDEKVTLFHIDIPNIGEYVFNDGSPIQAIGGGSTVGLMALTVAYTQGYRDLHLYGYDSSLRGKDAHAYAQSHDDSIVEAIVNERSFYTTPWMTVQVNQWQSLANQLRTLGCELTVHGEGLLPYLAWVMMQQETQS